jgi:signal peptidase II
VVAVDQLSKTWMLHHLASGPRHLWWTFRLSLQFNTGIAFSQATGSTTLVTVIALAVVAVLLVVAYRSRGAFTAAVLGLVIGGASGNLVDRLVRHHHGAVIDFIDPRWFPVFNLADAAVSVGVVLAVGHSLLTGGKHGD